jgi:hypothetical protein
MSRDGLCEGLRAARRGGSQQHRRWVAMGRSLFDDHGDADDVAALRVNEAFSLKYQERKQREELQRRA